MAEDPNRTSSGGTVTGETGGMWPDGEPDSVRDAFDARK